MRNFNQNDIKALFSGLCCSQCKNEITCESIKILSNDCNTMHCKLVCAKCGKDFGDIVFNFNQSGKSHSPLEVVDGPAPISYDDVIDAHNFIKNL